MPSVPPRRASAPAVVTILLLCSMGPQVRADNLPPTAPYLGEVTRNADGQLVAVPRPPAVTPDATAAPGAAGGRVLRVGPHAELTTITQASKVAREGDTIEIEAGDYVGDVAVWSQPTLTLRGIGGRPRLIAGGASAEGKAIWVIRGGDITVENIEFRDARVRDRNGAGIRLEKGRLTVRGCHFADNENGILTGNRNDAELTIENSEFDHNGAGDGQSHNLYVGAIARLTVEGSYFHHARVGHLLKSRAAESRILYNRLTDEAGGRASYELEFPAGGNNIVIGNIIEQSATTENSNIVSIGAEGYKHPRNALYLINNTLVDDRPANGTFLFAKPGPVEIKAINNLVLGKRPLASGLTGEFVNNPNVTNSDFVNAAGFDYRIPRHSPLQRTYVAPGMVGDIDLAPQREYVHPAHTRALPGAPTLPGARQTLMPDG